MVVIDIEVVSSDLSSGFVGEESSELSADLQLVIYGRSDGITNAGKTDSNCTFSSCRTISLLD